MLKDGCVVGVGVGKVQIQDTAHTGLQGRRLCCGMMKVGSSAGAGLTASINKTRCAGVLDLTDIVAAISIHNAVSGARHDPNEVNDDAHTPVSSHKVIFFCPRWHQRPPPSAMVGAAPVQELTDILAAIPNHNSAEDDLDVVDADADAPASNSDKRKKPLLQTFVFSATLTLPSSLRSRLRKGGVMLWSSMGSSCRIGQCRTTKHRRRLLLLSVVTALNPEHAAVVKDGAGQYRSATLVTLMEKLLCSVAYFPPTFGCIDCIIHFFRDRGWRAVWLRDAGHADGQAALPGQAQDR